MTYIRSLKGHLCFQTPVRRAHAPPALFSLQPRAFLRAIEASSNGVHLLSRLYAKGPPHSGVPTTDAAWEHRLLSRAAPG
jgi:hypothetical protein